MSFDTVDGGKVWIPQNPKQPKIRLRNIIQAVVCCAVTSGLIVFLLVYSAINDITNSSEPVSYLVQEIERADGHTSMSAIGFFVGFVIFISITGVFLMVLGTGVTAMAKVPRKYIFGGIGAGITLGLFVALFLTSNTKEPEDPKHVIDAWMQENYNYSLVEILPVNQEEDIHALFGVGEEKFVVEDVATGEEKTVHYYEKNGSLYLAVNDEDFLKQARATLTKTDTNDSSSQ